MYIKYFYFTLSFLILLLDFISKKWIVTHAILGEIKTILPFINFIYVHNSGIAFGLFDKENIICNRIISIIIIFIIIKLLLIMYKLDKHYLLINTAYTMIVSGAIGNLIDRIIYGTVIDFIDLHIYNLHSFIFNIADVSIFIGMIIIISSNIIRLYL